MSFRRTPHSSTNATKLSSLLHQSIQNPKPISQITPKPQLPISITTNPNTAIHYFNYLILLQPIPPISKFNQLLASVSNTHLAIILYRQLNNTHLPICPNLITLNIILDCYCNVNELGFGFGVLGLILKKGFVANCVTYTSLIKGLVGSNNNNNNNDNIVEAIRVFKKMVFLGVRPHGVTYGTLVNGLCRAGKVDVAVRFHEDIMRGDAGLGFVCKPNVVCYSMLIESLCETGRVSKAKELFHEMRMRRISPDGVSFSSLIRGLAFRDLDEAKRLFFEMVDEGVRLNVSVFNLLVSLLCKDGRLNEASGLFELMGRKGVKVEALSYTTLMRAYCLEGKVNEAKELYVSMVDNGIEPDVQVYNVLINGYVKIRRVDEALRIFKEFKQMIRENTKPNVVTYNALLTGLLQKGDVFGAQKLFHEMSVYHLTPSSCTYNVLLTGLCKNEHVLQALDLLQEVENNGVELGVRVYNSMIDGLCKSGRVETAWDVFTKLSSKGLKPTVVTYTIMIHGFCKTGRLKKADFLFLEMIENGCAPNMVTFNAFTRKGLDVRPKVVELVKKMAESKVKPDASTVSLMVDLLSKDEKYKQYLDMLIMALEVG